VLAGQWLAASDGQGDRIRFSDGSVATLAPAAAVRIVGLSPDGARLSLEKGQAGLDIRRRPGTRWTVDVGPYAVSVKGTRFSVSWEPGTQIFTFELHEGQVVVSGPLIPDGRRLSTGEAITAWVAEGRLEIGAKPRPVAVAAPIMEATPSTPDPVAGLSEVVPPSAACPVPARVPSSRPAAPPFATAEATGTPTGAHADDWRPLARAGSYTGALAAVDRQGIENVLTGSTADELMLLGDAARLAQRHDVSERCYGAVRSRYPGSPRAVEAAFALGRLAFDQERSYAKAAVWLARYLDEGGASTLLAREALGRLIEARDRSGDAVGARDAAHLYLARHPGGPHAGYARRLLQDADADTAP